MRIENTKDLMFTNLDSRNNSGMMTNKEIKDSLVSSLHESYALTSKERECILDVINRLEEVLGKEKTDAELAEKCKLVYQILRDKDPFRDFLKYLKGEKKFGAFCDTTYK